MESVRQLLGDKRVLLLVGGEVVGLLFTRLDLLVCASYCISTVVYSDFPLDQDCGFLNSNPLCSTWRLSGDNWIIMHTQKPPSRLHLNSEGIVKEKIYSLIVLNFVVNFVQGAVLFWFLLGGKWHIIKRN